MYCFHLNNVLYSRSSLNRLIFIISEKTDYREFIKFENEYESTATSSIGMRNRIEVDITLSREISFQFNPNVYYNIIIEAKKHCKFSNRIVYAIRQIEISDNQPFSYEQNDEIDEELLDEEEVDTLYDELYNKIIKCIDLFDKRKKILKKTLKDCGIKNIINVSQLHEALEKAIQIEF
jgi:hypothetical protein